MKLGKLLLMGMLSGFVFTACVDNDDKSEWNDGSQPVSFTSSIKRVKTRAADTKWTAGDKVGIFMKAVGGELSAATGVNKSHTADANGNLTASDADNALYYPTDGSAVDFIAYYPYTASLTGNTYKVDVTTQTDQPAIDLLYSDNAKNFAKGGASKPQLQFTHMLSQIVFNIEKDATIPSLNGLKVTFKGMNTKADFALADGTLSNAGTPANIVAVIEEATAKTIVLPAASLSNIQVVFELNNKTYTADYPQNTLEAGRKYTHKVKLSDSNGQPVIEMEPAAITDWIEVPGGDINVDFGGGSVTPSEITLLDEPFDADQGAFTLEDKLLPEGGNYVWKWNTYTDKETSVTTQYMKASAYIGGNKASESWLISPAINLTGVSDATLSFEHCHKFGVNKEEEMSVWIANEGTTDWHQLTIPTWGSGNNYIYVKAEINLKPYIGNNVKIAFKYVSTTAGAATWQINAVKVVGTNGESGGEVDPEPQPGVETVFIDESFGTPVKEGNYYPNLDKYTGWTDTHNLTYIDPLQTASYSNASVRATGELNGHVWFPASKDCALKISGFDTSNSSNLKLTYDITANKASDQNVITVSTDKGDVVVPSKDVAQNKYQTVELDLPDGINFVQFTSIGTKNTAGFRLDNVKLVGKSK